LDLSIFRWTMNGERVGVEQTRHSSTWDVGSFWDFWGFLFNQESMATSYDHPLPHYVNPVSNFESPKNMDKHIWFLLKLISKHFFLPQKKASSKSSQGDWKTLAKGQNLSKKRLSMCTWTGAQKTRIWWVTKTWIFHSLFFVCVSKVTLPCLP